MHCTLPSMLNDEVVGRWRLTTWSFYAYLSRSRLRIVSSAVLIVRAPYQRIRASFFRNEEEGNDSRMIVFDTSTVIVTLKK